MGSKTTILSLCLALAFVTFVSALSESEIKQDNFTNGVRQPKLLNVFQIVRFPNDPCTGTSNKNGTCYTEEECSSKGGNSEGSCAGGYGVCCVFTVDCGGKSSENCTYFQNPSVVSSGACVANICPCTDNICQLRLDFTTFAISGPSTISTTVGQTVNGRIVTNGGQAVSERTRCQVDTFVATSPGNNAPPVICGTNTNQHMYVEASPECNELSFQLGQATAVNRMWNIKVTQYTCDYDNLAPSGCTEYLFNPTSTSGTIQTYNWAGGLHLADQNQAFCIRTERATCRLCLWAAAAIDFSTSGNSNKASKNRPFAKSASCCRYGQAGIGAGNNGNQGYDCVVIPDAMKEADAANLPSRVCGRDKFILSTKNGNAISICTTRQPFVVRFMSDNWEFVNAITAIAEGNPANNNKGFLLQYKLDSTRCNP